MLHTGNIISGSFDEDRKEFNLQQVKHFHTETTISEEQLDNLYQYLKEHKDDAEGQIVTLYDQLPVRLSQEEISLLLSDLEAIQTRYL